MDTPDHADIPEIGGLDDFAPETPASAAADSADSASLMAVVRAEVSDETGAPRPLSRVEAVQARRAASSAAPPRWWNFSSGATRCHRSIAWVATRSRDAISSVANRRGRTVSSVATGSARAFASIATGFARAVLTVATGSSRAASWVATRSGRAVTSTATGSDGAASSVVRGSREAISSTAEQARHAIASAAGHSRRRIAAAVALLALGYDSWSRAAGRAVRGARGRFALRPDRTPGPAGELRDLESEGSFVAAALVVVVVSYGALLLLSWRDPVPERSVAPAAVRAVTSPAPAPASSVTTNVALAPVVDPAPAIVRPASARLSTASLRAVWNRSDTRSLQRALNNLRSQTLALHRCGMQVTATDRAIAQCDGSSHATYTIDFQRFADRWVIQRVSSR